MSKRSKPCGDKIYGYDVSDVVRIGEQGRPGTKGPKGDPGQPGSKGPQGDQGNIGHHSTISDGQSVIVTLR